MFCNSTASLSCGRFPDLSLTSVCRGPLVEGAIGGALRSWAAGACARDCLSPQPEIAVSDVTTATSTAVRFI